MEKKTLLPTNVCKNFVGSCTRKIQEQLLPQIKIFLVATLSLVLSANVVKAQVINEGFEESVWQGGAASSSGCTSGAYVITATSANSTMTYYITNSYTGTYSTSTSHSGTNTSTSTRFTSTLTSTGLNTSPNSGTWWYSRGCTSSDSRLQKAHSASTSWELGSSGYLITPVVSGGIVTVSFWAAPEGGFFVGANTATAIPMVQGYSSNSTSNGYTLDASAYPANGTAGYTSMQQFTYTAVVTAPFELGFFNLGSSIYIDDIQISVNPGTAPSVTTSNSVTPTQTTAAASGTITANNPTPNAIVDVSGMIYSTSSSATLDTSLSTKTTDGPTGVTSGTINSTITGLTPSTTYYARAYALTTAGVVYGNTINFRTLAPTAPVVSTNTVSYVSSTKGGLSGNLTDSGGVSIDSVGFVWGTNATPTLSNSTVTTGGSFGTYVDTLTGLTPATTYYARAYAINSVGTTYGNIVSFTTLDSTASIYATPTSLNFGNVTYDSSDVVKSYTLSARKLVPPTTPDSISVTAPTGFLVSLSPNSGFASSINIGYNQTTGSLNSTTIYVKMLGSQYGIYNGAIIVHSGGSATSDNIQNVYLTGSVIMSSTNYSSSGIDFWTGFGMVEEMSDNKASMSVYIAAGNQDAVVNVDIPGLGWSYPGNPITVPAHTVFEVTPFPTTTPDSRLDVTGVSGKAVHVYSTNGVPVSVWTYTSATDNTAAGCMNFPTNTWNSQYTVQAYAGPTNESYPNSYFFVIAKDSNTTIQFTPTTNIIDAGSQFNNNPPLGTTYLAGNTYTLTLNRGQVFNAIAYINGAGNLGNVNYDLSGTLVKSLDCNKKIAVFGGNARCLVDTSTSVPQTVNASSGSDNLMQQMFPTVAWGKTYLTVPTKTMEDNYYRIYVQDSTKTQVTVNGQLLDTNTLVNYLYYQISGSGLAGTYVMPYDSSGNHFYKIVGSNAISVAQFIVATAIAADKNSAASGIGNNGKGDPEMILLSPTQQAITSITVATPNFKNGGSGGHYINVVIPKAGVSSFKITADTTTYSLVDSASTGLYTVGTSWEYHTIVDAGSIDRSSILVDTGATSYVTGYAYASAPAAIWLDSAFQPYPSDPNYYYAKFLVTYPNSYTMTSDVGFNATAYGMDAGESYGFNAGTNLKNLSNNITVGVTNGNGPVQSSVNGSLVTCLSVPFKFTVGLPFRADSLKWNFSNNPNLSPNATVMQKDTAITKSANWLVLDSTSKTSATDSICYYTLRDSSGNPIKFTFAQLGSYPVTISAYSQNISIVGLDVCNSATVSDSVTFPAFNVNVVAGVAPGFITNYVKCQADTIITFTDQSIDGLGAKLIGWSWNFGNGKVDSVDQNPIVSYPKHGTYNVIQKVTDSIGCYWSDTTQLTLAYAATAKFGSSSSAVCINNSLLFTDSSSTIGDSLITWQWNFNGTIVNESFPTAGNTIPVTLTVTNKGGCSATTSENIFVDGGVVPSFTTNYNKCQPGTDTTIKFTDLSVSKSGVKLTNWNWNFGNGKAASIENPSSSYTVHGIDSVKLTVTDSLGCYNDTIIPLTIAYQPIAKFGSKDTVCENGSLTFTDSSTSIGDTISTWAWTFVGGTPATVNASTNAKQTITYNTVGNYIAVLKVTNNGGCSNTTSPPANITVLSLPVASFNLPGDLCLPDAYAVFINTTPGTGNIYTWNYGDANTGTTDTGTHTYTSYGSYTVSLSVKTANGCVSTPTQQTLNTIYPRVTVTTDPTTDFLEDFETGLVPPSVPGGGTWHDNPVGSWISSAGGAFGSGSSVTVANTTIGTSDTLTTPVINVAAASSIYDLAYIRFDLGVKTNATSTNDSIIVYASTDCGGQNIPIFRTTVAQLLQSGSNTSGGINWTRDSVEINSLSNVNGSLIGQDVRYKIVYKSVSGQNIYVDNVKVYYILPEGTGYTIYPVPFQNSFTLEHFYSPYDLTSITLFSMSGQLIKNIQFHGDAPQIYTVDLGTIANGQYIMVLDYTDKPRVVRKVLKEN